MIDMLRDRPRRARAIASSYEPNAHEFMVLGMMRLGMEFIGGELTRHFRDRHLAGRAALDGSPIVSTEDEGGFAVKIDEVEWTP